MMEKGDKVIKHVCYKGTVADVRYDRVGAYVNLKRVLAFDLLLDDPYSVTIPLQEEVVMNFSFFTVNISSIRSLSVGDKVEITVKTTAHPGNKPVAMVESIINSKFDGVEVVNALL